MFLFFYGRKFFHSAVRVGADILTWNVNSICLRLTRGAHKRMPSTSITLLIMTKDTKPLYFCFQMTIGANPGFDTFYSQPSNTLLHCYTKKFLNIRKINLQVFKFYAKLPILPDPMVICQPFDCYSRLKSLEFRFSKVSTENRSCSSSFHSEFFSENVRPACFSHFPYGAREWPRQCALTLSKYP